MKQKKSIIIIVSVVAVCVLGVVASKVFNWPVIGDQASGNVAKSSRFSRKTAEDGASNMQELLLNDENYKNGLVAAYMVMSTRAKQFDALVDMSSEVAGNIKEFESVLKDMKAAQPMVANVCESMDKAGKDLNAALGGENVKELAQNTTNAALAYSTLQKQNTLATRFIDTADAYLAKSAGDDRLKFVRDQWVEYQQLTAALNKDEAAAAELKEKGLLLNGDQTISALASFSGDVQNVLMSGATIENMFGFSNLFVHLHNSAEDIAGDLSSVDMEVVKNTTDAGYVIGHTSGEVDVLNSNQIIFPALNMMEGMDNLISAIGTVIVQSVGNSNGVEVKGMQFSNDLGTVIQNMATGDVAGIMSNTIGVTTLQQ